MKETIALVGVGCMVANMARRLKDDACVITAVSDAMIKACWPFGDEETAAEIKHSTQIRAVCVTP
mgnify:CR=1 FL=1